MTKGVHTGHYRTRSYTGEYKRVYARSFKPLLGLPVNTYEMDIPWLGKECSKFELITCDDWKLVMLFTIQGKEIPVPLVTDDSSASTKLYLVCPYCAKQRQHLYATKSTFSCGGCLKLSYQSQSMRPQERLAERIRKLRTKTWGYGWKDRNNLTEWSLDWPRPKGMHQTTFDNIRHKLFFLEKRYWDNSPILGEVMNILNRC